jgi:hypothetical protein
MHVFTRPILYASLVVALLSLSQCTHSDPAPVDQLPPATQTGEGTFGCLLNGQPWTPSGYTGRPNFVTTYDEGYAGGSLQIKCTRYTSGSTFQSITIGASNVQQTGTYSFAGVKGNGLGHFDTSLPAACSIQSGTKSGAFMDGQLTITRFDLPNHIIAGTFTLTLHQPGCDTLKLTHGRFDYTL